MTCWHTVVFFITMDTTLKMRKAHWSDFHPNTAKILTKFPENRKNVLLDVCPIRYGYANIRSWFKRAEEEVTTRWL